MSNTAITPFLDVSEFKNTGSATSRRVTVNPENMTGFTSSTSTTDVYWALPASGMGFINPQNSTLDFDIVTSAAGAFCSGDASSLISAIEMTIGNTVVELNTNYAVISNFINEFQTTARSRTVGNILSGHSTGTLKTGADLATKTRISIGLLSASVGQLAENYLPAVAGMRLKITFASSANAIIHASETPTYTLSNLKLQMDYLDIVPSTYQQLMAESGGVFKIHGKGVGHFSSTLDLAQTNHSLLIPARYSSVKNFYTLFRVSSNIASFTKNSTGARINPKILNYNYNIGGKSYPSVNVVCHDGTVPLSGEVFTELVKTFHASNSPDFNCVFAKAEYEDVTGTDVDGSFAMGLELEEMGGGKVLSGLDTMNSNVFLEMNTVSGSANITADHYCVYDQIIEINMQTGETMITK